ncbi:MAG: DUF2269 family protein [Chloroflexota bacterium]
MLYPILKWIHILAAIIALGANLTYPLWMTLAQKRPESLVFTLKTVKLMDDRMANPPYVLALLTGIGMVHAAGIPYTTPWIAAALILYAVVSVLGLGAYSPLLKKQIALAESPGPDSADYKAIALRGNILGGAISLMVIAITFLMTVKPQLW